MIKGSVSKIETFGLVDGPGIRTVVFLSGCKLRCKYCHNPEMWKKDKDNYIPEELAKKILRNKNYFNRNGGVTFSGGEPLLQSKFIIEVCKILKKENIHIALDTSGVGNGDYEEILKYVDLVILDIKHTNNEGYKEITGLDINESLIFRSILNKSNKDVWIRQVIVPDVNDNEDYLKELVKEVRSIKNVKKIEFLPYHNMALDKYKELGLDYPYKEKQAMDLEKCNQLYEMFMKIYNNN